VKQGDGGVLDKKIQPWPAVAFVGGSSASELEGAGGSTGELYSRGARARAT
jgi:hypothetical protein